MFWLSVWNKWKPRWARVFSLDSFIASDFEEAWRFQKAPHFPRKIRRFQKGIGIGFLVLWTCQHLLTEKQMVRARKLSLRPWNILKQRSSAKDSLISITPSKIIINISWNSMKHTHFQYTNSARRLVPMKDMFSQGVVICENLFFHKRLNGTFV